MTEGAWQPLHPAAIATNALRAAGGLVLPIAIALLRSRSLGQLLLTGGIGVALALLAGVYRWRTNRWRVTATAVEHKSGWLSLTERSVPLRRVQSVDASAGLLQRAFGVVGVRVQTAGGSSGEEIALAAVAPADVRRLREAAGIAVGAAPARTWRLGGASLALAGATTISVGLVVSAVAGAWQLGQELLGDDRSGLLRLAESIAPGSAAGWVVVAAAVLLASWALGAVGTMAAFAGFTLSREDDRISVSRGLLARRDTSIAVGRVRAVRVVEGLLRQPLGRCAVRVDVLGGGDESPRDLTLFPLLRRDEVAATLAEWLPEHAAQPLGLAGAPRRAARRFMLPPALAGLVLAAVWWAWLPGGGPWALGLPLLGAGWGLIAFRAVGWRIGPGDCALRSRRVARVTVLFDPGSVQQAAVAANPLQRRAGLASVRVAVGHDSAAAARHLEAPVAWSLWEVMSRRP